ncbi:MAG TPA: YetF domain-containing protein [Bryobacteraceae bacterium]|jgi:uncharacterized membrane protein YcaP (DUF421 family)|nr:YetF domain-containing protein [Bryobacteraceae bacterium]
MSTIIHAVIGYFWLLFTVRFLSRRPGAQMTPFEFVLIFLIGGVIILSCVGNDHSETNSVIAVMTVGLLHRFVSALAVRYRKFGAIVEGIPLVLIDRGQRRTEIMWKMRIQDPDIMAAGRVKGARTFQEIRYAVLERLGSISIIKNKDE